MEAHPEVMKAHPEVVKAHSVELWMLTIEL
jgi:hypothetical protein